jgi:hypothetical protein
MGTASQLPTEVLQRFTKSNPEYRGDETQSGAVVIATKVGSPCEVWSRGTHKGFSSSGTALEVLYQLFRAWANEESQYLPPGLLGKEDREIYLAEVSVSVADGTLEDALYELVEQVPGLGWSIKEERGLSVSPGGAKRGCSVGLFTGRSWMLTDWVIPNPQIK